MRSGRTIRDLFLLRGHRNRLASHPGDIFIVYPLSFQLYNASAPNFFSSSRDNNTTGKVSRPFRSARFASSRSARVNLYKLWRAAMAVDDGNEEVFCKVVIPQGEREPLFSPETTWHPYFIRRKSIGLTRRLRGRVEDRNSLNSVIFEKKKKPHDNITVWKFLSFSWYFFQDELLFIFHKACHHLHDNH